MLQVDLASGRVSYESAAPIPREDLDRVVKAAGFELGACKIRLIEAESSLGGV